jgi:hypothetical protein
VAFLITVVVVVVVVELWNSWERRRGLDDEHVARQADYGWRVIKLIGLAVVLLTVGLALEALGMPGAGVTALIALAALVLLLYAAPWLGPRQRR